MTGWAEQDYMRMPVVVFQFTFNKCYFSIMVQPMLSFSILCSVLCKCVP